MSDPLTHHQNFTDDMFDAQYNLRAGRPDYDVTVIPNWRTRSQEAQAQLKCSLDIRYGAGEKQKLDVYPADGAATLVYFHGGYWQRGDKSIYGFLAAPFVAVGISVVVVGYDLCPSVTITQISAQARAAMAHIWQHADALGVARDQITVMGHSAGGHLTQMMMATDWPALDPTLPLDMIKAGIPISPLSYLEPVRLTKALNDGIRMDAQEAYDESPMTCHPPQTDAPQLVVVGGAETGEFHRQARIYQEAYQTPSRMMDLYVVPDVDHFDELNVLADPRSPFFEKACAMILPPRSPA